MSLIIGRKELCNGRVEDIKKVSQIEAHKIEVSEITGKRCVKRMHDKAMVYIFLISIGK